jgi:hypothetical protein
MKTSAKLFLLTLLLSISGIPGLMAHDQYSRVIKKEYPVNPDAQLVISNQYGKIHCSNWDKPVIAVEIVLSVEASNEQAAQKLLNNITVEMTSSPSLVSIKSSIDKGGVSGHSKFNVDIDVRLPSGINIDFTNKFGDIELDVVDGKSKINLSYGNMEINKLNNSDNLLDVKFSKANVRSMKGAVVLLKYSELEAGYAGSLRLDSKYSNISADKIVSLTGTLEGGDVEVTNSSAVDVKSKFSDLSFTKIETSLDLDIQYGSFETEEMPATFSSININNKYGDVSIGLSKEASYDLDANLKFCDLDFPSDKASFTQKIKTNTSKSYKATVGSNANPSSKVTVNSEFGNISFE